MASPATELAWNAGYSQLPFDLFILSWYRRMRDAPSEIRGVDPLPSPTEEQIVHIFKPYRSNHERNLSAKFCCGWDTLWLRTCYTLALSQQYLELEQAVGVRVEGSCLENSNHVLNDASLYAFIGTDQQVMDQLLLRLPGLTDSQGIQDEYGDGSLLLYGNGKNDAEAIEKSESGDERQVKTVALNVQNFVYAVDDEAEENNIIKVWWFDGFGKIVWDNIADVPESNLDGILGAIMNGQGFADLVGEDSQRGDVVQAL
ncbi:hypothetical protein NX059_005016 [Plenodomus lindquistii]|nr:hypothetical protein NX059_005016 [Plenodomus lindquistii]